jgi:hypothetical protein
VNTGSIDDGRKSGYLNIEAHRCQRRHQREEVMLRSTFVSHRIAIPCAAAGILGLALLAGCDRLGLGRGKTIAVDPAGKTNLDEEKGGPPPARDPIENAVATSVEGPTRSAANPGANGDGEETPPARAPIDDQADPPLLSADDFDKPMEPPPEAEGLIRMPDPEEKGSFQDLWVDKEQKRIVLAGRVCKRTGDMELFACFRRTKEHESIVSVRARAYAIHATLVALGVKPGRSVQFFPEFRAAEGPEMDVTVAWTDEKGERRTARAQEWLRNVRTGKEMEQPWIFAGSGFWKDPDGKTHYLASDGDFICVSNFTSAMLDIPINAPSANAALLFQGYHERIPPAGTPVALILRAKPRKPLEAPPAK